MDCCSLVSVMNFFLPFVFPLVAFCLLLPQSVKEFRKWKKDHNPQRLSLAIISIIFSIFFICTFYQTSMGYLIKHSEMVAIPQFFKLLLLIVITFFVYYVSIPQSIRCYNSWKVEGKPAGFSLIILLGLLSIFLLRFAYLISTKNWEGFPNV